MRVPLQMKTTCVESPPNLLRHCKSALKRGLPEFCPTPNAIDMPAVIVGTGPTMLDFMDDIRVHKEDAMIFAVNDAHDILLNHGIVPHFAVSVDPKARIRKCFQKKDSRILYLLASQCHPGVFDWLRDQTVVLWHPHVKEIYEYFKLLSMRRHMVNGGTTSGLRSLVLAHGLGHRHIHIYGMDCNIQGEGEKAIRNATGRKPKQKNVLPVIVNGRKFYATKAMAAQSTELMQILSWMPGIKIKVYGDTLLAQIVKEGKERGRKECYEPGEDFHGSRQQAAFSLFRGPVVHAAPSFTAPVGDTADAESIADQAQGPDRVHLHAVPRPVAV